MNKYLLLKVVMVVTQIGGVVTFLFGLWMLVATIFYGQLNDFMNPGQSLIASIGIMVQALFLLAFGQLIRLLLDLRAEMQAMREEQAIHRE